MNTALQERRVCIYVISGFMLSSLSFIAGQVYARWATPFLAGAVTESKLTDHFWFTILLPQYALFWAGVGLFCAAVAAVLVPLNRWRLHRLFFPVFMLLAVLLRWVSINTALNTVPGPDGVHYAVSAMRLVGQGSFLLPFGEHLLPSRMPPGPAFAMAAVQWIRPGELGFGIYAVWLSSILTLWLVYLTGSRLAGNDVGKTAAVLLALSPLHIHYSRVLMGENPWALAVLLALFLLCDTSRRNWTALMGGAIMGLSILFKPPHLMVIAGTGPALAILMWRQPRIWARRSLLFWGAAALGCLAWPLYNYALFGHALVTGYHAFSPEYYASAMPSY